MCTVYPTSSGPDSGETDTLARTQSFRVPPKNQRIFRAADLIKGDLLGTGFFGKVFKVGTGDELVDNISTFFGMNDR